MTLHHITSPKNEEFRKALKLLKSKGIKKWDQHLLFGEKILSEILRENTLNKKSYSSPQIESVFAPQDYDFKEETPFNKGLSRSGLPVFVLPKTLFYQLDVFGTQFPIFALKNPSYSTWSEESEVNGVEIFCATGNPINLGTIVRTAVGFDVTKIVLLNECCLPLLPQAVRSSSGAYLKMKFEYGPSITELASLFGRHSVRGNSARGSSVRGSSIRGDHKGDLAFALDLNGRNLFDYSWPKNIRLIVGEEGKGIPDNLVSEIERLTIPISAKLESLNAATSVSIALACYRQTHRA